MGIKQRLQAAVKVLMTGTFTGRLFSIISSARMFRRKSVEVDPYANFAGWAYFAIDRMAERVGGITPRLYRLASDGTVQEVDDHELLALLFQANPYMTRSDLLYLTAVYLRMWGSAPWWLERSGRSVAHIWPLRPDLLRVNSDSRGNVTGYEYMAGGGMIKMAAEDVMYIRKPDPKNFMKGYGAMQAAALEIDADAMAAVWNRYVLENSAEPSLVLQTDEELSDEAYERIEKSWNARLAGPGNAGKPAILESGLKVEKLSQTNKELDFNETRKTNKEFILTLLGFPPALIDALANRANAETADLVFARDCVDPTARVIFDQLNEFLVPKFGADLWLDYDSVIPDDREQRRLDQQASVNQWRTVNEVREMDNLPPLDGGDVLFMPIGVMPQVGPEQPAAKALPGGAAVKVVEFRAAKAVMTRREKEIARRIKARTFRTRKVADGIADRIVAKIAAKARNPERVSVKIITSGGRKDEGGGLHPSIKAERVAYLKKLPAKEKEFAKVLRKFFDGLEDEVMANLEEAGVGKAGRATETKAVDDLLFDMKDADKAIVKATKGPYVANVKEGAEDISELLGIEVVQVDVTTFLAEKAVKIVEINRTTADELRVSLAEALDAGESLGEIQSRVAEIFNMARGFRTETIARTEVGSAMNYGRTAEMQAIGVERKMWVAIGDGDTREDHAEANGQIVDVDKAFDVGGETLEYPQDPAGSPENVINCRCSVSPTIDK